MDRFHSVYSIRRETSDGYLWSGEETDKTASDIQARLFMARTLDEIGKECEAEERQKWSREKPQLDNARKLRGIYFIDPEDKEFIETMKNARKKLETSVAPAMLESYFAQNILVTLITTDHKMPSEECESRNNHRYAIVVQDSVTQWIQFYQCETKTSHDIQGSLQKFLEPSRKPKVVLTDNSLKFGKACEDLQWNHCTSTPHRSGTNGIAESNTQKKETFSILLHSGLDEIWWADSMECYCNLRSIHV